MASDGSPFCVQHRCPHGAREATAPNHFDGGPNRDHDARGWRCATDPFCWPKAQGEAASGVRRYCTLADLTAAASDRIDLGLMLRVIPLLEGNFNCPDCKRSSSIPCEIDSKTHKAFGLRPVLASSCLLSDLANEVVSVGLCSQPGAEGHGTPPLEVTHSYFMRVVLNARQKASQAPSLQERREEKPPATPCRRASVPSP